MIRCWLAWRGGEMGCRVLPDPGGFLQQPAIMLDAFASMDAARDELVRAEAPQD